MHSEVAFYLEQHVQVLNTQLFYRGSGKEMACWTGFQTASVLTQKFPKIDMQNVEEWRDIPEECSLQMQGTLGHL